MFNTTEIEELATRKRLLKIESELNRQALSTEISRLRESAAKAQTLLSSVRSFYPVLLVLAPIAGYFLSRTAETHRSVGRVLQIWRWARSLRPLWARCREFMSGGTGDKTSL